MDEQNGIIPLLVAIWICYGRILIALREFNKAKKEYKLELKRKKHQDEAISKLLGGLTIKITTNV